MNEDKYAKSLAKNQVCAIIDMRDIRKNVLPKFIRLLICMETTYWCPFTVKPGHKRIPQDHINEFINRKLNPLVVVDFRFISSFLHA